MRVSNLPNVGSVEIPFFTKAFQASGNAHIATFTVQLNSEIGIQNQILA